MENEAEFYYEKLKNTQNPGTVLCEFFTEITGRPHGRPEIIMINKFIKNFGRFTVYFAILELSRYDNLDENLYGLIHRICANRFERAHDTVFSMSREPLDRYLKELEKEIEKVRKSKGKSPTSEDL